jgi:hypothetical protein
MLVRLTFFDRDPSQVRVSGRLPQMTPAKERQRLRLPSRFPSTETSVVSIWTSTKTMRKSALQRHSMLRRPSQSPSTAQNETKRVVTLCDVSSCVSDGVPFERNYSPSAKEMTMNKNDRYLLIVLLQEPFRSIYLKAGFEFSNEAQRNFIPWSSDIERALGCEQES